MLNKFIQFNTKKAWFISGTIGAMVLLLCLYIGTNVLSAQHQREVLETTEHYYQFQQKVDNLIQDNILLLKGYLAYVKTFEETSQQKTYEYLDHLTKDNIELIRNIAIIKDTTIVFNHPLEGNESSIGVDLALNENQREDILRIKETLNTIFVGPIDLVQGGRGFIIRHPILDKEGLYWGQVSIVLKADQVISEIHTFADELSINFLIENPYLVNEVIAGDVSIDKRNALTFVLDENLTSWVVYLEPEEGWYNTVFEQMILVMISLILGFLTAGLSYIYLRNNYEIRYNSLHDPLTRLYNRLFFDEYGELILANALRHNKKIGIILIDLDRFKEVNDTYGHKIGDEVLKKSALIIKKLTRTNEAVFRLGGDEFLLVAPEVYEEKEVEMIKDRIDEAFRNEFEIVGYDIQMIPSIGVGLYPVHGTSLDEVMHHADTQMYQEKEEHRKRRR